MNGPAHYKEAERLTGLAHDMADQRHQERADFILGRALVHATLALAAATVDVGMKYDGAVRNEEAWREVTKP